jgi:hypothetical protein
MAPPSLASAADYGEWSASRSDRFASKEIASDSQCKSNLVGPRSRFGPCGVEKESHLPGIEFRLSSPKPGGVRHNFSRRGKPHLMTIWLSTSCRKMESGLLHVVWEGECSISRY